MMAKKQNNNNVAIAAGLGVAGLAAYFLFGRRAAAGPLSSAPGSSIPTTPIGSLPRPPVSSADVQLPTPMPSSMAMSRFQQDLRIIAIAQGDAWANAVVADGLWGPNTLAAARAFKASLGLASTTKPLTFLMEQANQAARSRATYLLAQADTGPASSFMDNLSLMLTTLRYPSLQAFAVDRHVLNADGSTVNANVPGDERLRAAQAVISTYRTYAGL